MAAPNDRGAAVEIFLSRRMIFMAISGVTDYTNTYAADRANGSHP